MAHLRFISFIRYRIFSVYIICIRIYREDTAVRARFRDLNPFLRVGVPRRPISRVDESRERTRRHRISAEIAHRQIGWTIYSPVVTELGEDVEKLYRRRLSWPVGPGGLKESPMSN